LAIPTATPPHHTRSIIAPCLKIDPPSVIKLNDLYIILLQIQIRIMRLRVVLSSSQNIHVNIRNDYFVSHGLDDSAFAAQTSNTLPNAIISNFFLATSLHFNTLHIRALLFF
jgi:hypothetical protein